MRKKIRTIKLLLLIIVIIGSGFGYYYSRYIAPDSYSIKKTTITNNSLPDEFKNFEIGFISDINLQKSSERIKTFSNKGNGENAKLAERMIKSTADAYVNRAIELLKSEALKGSDSSCAEIIEKIFLT